MINFDALVKILVFGGILFFVVFAWACALWTTRDLKDKKTIFTGAALSLIYTFQIFFIGTIILILVYGIFVYLPSLGF